MDYKEIVLAKISSLLSKKYFIIHKNGEIKKSLKCCDLNEMYEKNEDYIEPNTYSHYNGGKYEYDNQEYNLFIGLDNIFTELYTSSNIKGILRLLKELAENFNPYLLEVMYEDEEYKKYFDELNSLYQVFGLCIKIENEKFKVDYWSGKSENKIKDMFSVEEWLSDKYPEVYSSYEGAITTYANGNYGTCIEACRTTLTGLFSKFKGSSEFAKWLRAISNISGEMDDGDLKELKNNMDKATTKNDLANFFGENAEGRFTKTRAIYMIYSMMSDYGTHREEGIIEKPTHEDALMMFRMTEDIMIWIFMKVAN